MSRRRFLWTASPWLGLALFPNIAEAIPTQNSELSDGQLKELQANLLAMINEERSVAQVPVLAMDDLASRVAAGHALDMAKGKFASHWGSDGRKPYQRYSLAGGTHATEENVSSANNTWSLKPADIAQDVAYLHVRLYSETPPNDGHRRTILAPQHTHVGFGIAIAELRLRVVELFVAKHVDIDHITQRAKPGATIEVAGRLLNPGYMLAQIEVFYELPPRPPQLAWLQAPRPYSLPDESITLRPRLRPPRMYADGSRGIIESDGSYFRTLVTLFKDSPGIYTIACWLQRSNTEKPFIATLICIQAE